MDVTDIALLRQVFTHAHKSGWRRVTHPGAVAAWMDDRDSLITLERFDRDLVLDVCGYVRMDADRLPCVVDVLVSVGVLPKHLHSAWAARFERLMDRLDDCADLGDKADRNADVDRVLGQAREYWLGILGDRVDQLRYELVGLLDDGYAGRRQAADIVVKVREVLSA